MTAVEWLEKRLLGIVYLDTEYSTIEYEKIINKAKGMEQQQKGYSEEDMIRFMQFIVSEEELENTSGVSVDTAKYFLNKFKNK